MFYNKKLLFDFRKYKDFKLQSKNTVDKVEKQIELVKENYNGR